MKASFLKIAKISGFCKNGFFSSEAIKSTFDLKVLISREFRSLGSFGREGEEFDSMSSSATEAE